MQLSLSLCRDQINQTRLIFRSRAISSLVSSLSIRQRPALSCDRAAPGLMPQIGHGSLDPCVSPRSILKCHAQNEIDDRPHDARPTGASTMAVVPLTCDHFSVPSQEGIWCDQGMKFGQDLASESVRFSGESTALGISETNALPTQALLEYPVLFPEILDHVQLTAVDPPGISRAATEEAEMVGTLQRSIPTDQPTCVIERPACPFSDRVAPISGHYGERPRSRSQRSPQDRHGFRGEERAETPKDHCIGTAKPKDRRPSSTA